MIIMNKPIKAAMLSLFIYPGAGQVFLKRYKTATVFIVLFSIPFCWLLWDMIEQTNQLMKTVIENNLPLNVATLTDMFKTLTSAHTQAVSNKGTFMVIIWLLSSVDAYRAVHYQNIKRNEPYNNPQI